MSKKIYILMDKKENYNVAAFSSFKKAEKHVMAIADANGWDVEDVVKYGNEFPLSIYHMSDGSKYVIDSYYLN